MKISVILCAHNPRADHFAATLAALQKQTLPGFAWELIVVDNASDTPIELPAAPLNTLSARVVREPALGLVAARVRGIAEAHGDLLVWVDDDNLLAPDYLERALALALRWPDLGAFGGQIHPQFEIPPTPWFAARLDRLAIREFDTASRGKQIDLVTVPCGAGLCVRADVAAHYRAVTLADPSRASFGRFGPVIFSGDDLDLAFSAKTLDREIGRFPELELIHLIPAERLTLRYFARITRAHARGTRRLLQLHGLTKPFSRTSRAALWAHWKWSIIDSFLSLFPVRHPAHVRPHAHPARP